MKRLAQPAARRTLLGSAARRRAAVVKAAAVPAAAALAAAVAWTAGGPPSAADEPQPDAPVAAADWPQWRGPSRDGQAPLEPAWGAKIDAETLVEVWRKPLGPSYSGPIVAGNRVFATETRDQKSEVVTAFDRETGESLWHAEWEGALQVPFFAASNGSWIRATPACDGERLYVAGIRDVLACLDARDGKELWRIDFAEKYATPPPAFGFVSSPLVDGDFVYVQAAESFVKLDKRTGEVAWRTAVDAGESMNSAFSSPIKGLLGGRELLIVQTRESLKGVAIDSGAELWSQNIQAFRGMNILTPTLYGGALFTSAHSGRTQLWNLSPDGASLAEAWSQPAQAYMGSPVVIGDYAYLHLRNQRFCCIDLRTGEEAWRTKPFGKYWSLVAQGDRLLALDETGDLRLIEANPAEFRLLDARHVADSSTWAHLAVSGDHVFVRALDSLIVYRWAR